LTKTDVFDRPKRPSRERPRVGSPRTDKRPPNGTSSVRPFPTTSDVQLGTKMGYGKTVFSFQ
jgi:hypothetical protein